MAGNITLASRKVQLLLFADDLVLLADSSKGLQDSLYWLTEFCKTWKLNGIILSSNGSFKLAIFTIAKQASKALFSLFRTASQLSFPDPLLLCYLFDTLVRPVLEYGNEIWSCYPTEELEVVHKRFCKFALGVSRSATNLACSGELGRTPLMIIGKISQIKYWLRVTVDWSIPILVKDACALAKVESLEWVNYIQNILTNACFPCVDSSFQGGPK